jgi:hypothetical protein
MKIINYLNCNVQCACVCRIDLHIARACAVHAVRMLTLYRTAQCACVCCAHVYIYICTILQTLFWIFSVLTDQLRGNIKLSQFFCMYQPLSFIF